MDADMREELGQVVRAAWVAWARQQPAPKPSWLVPWEALSEPDKEADRCIGAAVAAYVQPPAFMRVYAVAVTATPEHDAPFTQAHTYAILIRADGAADALLRALERVRWHYRDDPAAWSFRSAITSTMKECHPWIDLSNRY